VTFQAIKPTIPISARPPQTDSPTIEPVPSLDPLLAPSGSKVGLGLAEDDERGTVTIIVTLLPSDPVVSIWEIVSLGGALVGLLEVGGGVGGEVVAELVDEELDGDEESPAGWEAGWEGDGEAGGFVVVLELVD